MEKITFDKHYKVENIAHIHKVINIVIQFVVVVVAIAALFVLHFQMALFRLARNHVYVIGAWSRFVCDCVNLIDFMKIK